MVEQRRLAAGEFVFFFGLGPSICLVSAMVSGLLGGRFPRRAAGLGLAAVALGLAAAAGLAAGRLAGGSASTGAGLSTGFALAAVRLGAGFDRGQFGGRHRRGRRRLGLDDALGLGRGNCDGCGGGLRLGSRGLGHGGLDRLGRRRRRRRPAPSCRPRP